MTVRFLVRAVAAMAAGLVLVALPGGAVHADAASAAAASAVPKVLIKTVQTPGDGFAFAGAPAGGGDALAPAPPATSTLVDGVVFFSSTTAATTYSFSNGTTTVAIPAAALTSDVIAGRTVVKAVLSDFAPGLVGSSASTTFTGSAQGGEDVRWRFAAIYTTPGGTENKQVALVGDPVEVPVGGQVSMASATPLTPSSATSARVGARGDIVPTGVVFTVDSNGTTGTTQAFTDNVALGTSVWGAGATSATARFGQLPRGNPFAALAYAVSYELPVGVPAASLSPSSHNFGDQKVGTTGPGQTFTLTNTGATTVSVSGVTLAGANPADYTITGNNCGGAVLAPTGTCTVTVAFAPTATGLRTATLSVASNAGTKSAALTGTGVTAPAENTADLQIKVDAPKQVEPGERYTYTVTVKNKGPAAAQGVVAALDLRGNRRVISVVSVSPQPSGGGEAGLNPQLNYVDWEIGTLAAGEVQRFRVNVTAPDRASTVEALARVKSTTEDPRRSNNSQRILTRVEWR
ncbi:choice-of-anchor D domain-containing protein [Streptomyces sp. NPDC000410]|uniref:choice-of-anchor D domain-containing protein n=1 Tax=Streptomyces sp. NPDC000410 TaxID=3154254 RepID=UPI00331CC12C